MKRLLMQGIFVIAVMGPLVCCDVTAPVDIGVTMRPTGAPRSVDCSTAFAPTVKFQVFDRALDDLLRTEVTSPCDASQRYQFKLEVGAYKLRVLGLNEQMAVCYATDYELNLRGGPVAKFDVVADQYPQGADNGCEYPDVLP